MTAPRAPGEPKWKVGDTCYLKSGSPRMVITGITDDKLSLVGIAYDRGVLIGMTVPSACVKKDWK